MTRFGVPFPLSPKIELNGPGRHPLYASLTQSGPGEQGDIQWNFEKFLIGRDGEIVRRYPSGTQPTDSRLMVDPAESI
jgi:glutathione peroxidase